MELEMKAIERKGEIIRPATIREKWHGEMLIPEVAMVEKQEFNKVPKELVRCKDCKHRPKVVEEKDSVGVMETHYEFPEDSKCPCQNTNDQYYSWCPDDDWFCADGERAVT